MFIKTNGGKIGAIIGITLLAIDIIWYISRAWKVAKRYNLECSVSG